MYIIGLTGGIASGKSSVSKILAGLGAAIVDTDAIARVVVEPDQPAWRQIVEHFGQTVLQPDGSLNRRKLGDIVFANSAERKQLEAITHPAIWHETIRRLKAVEAAGQTIAVLDVPLLFETGWHKRVESVWVVYVNREIQLARLMQRDNLTRQQAELRIASQLSLETKKQLADVVIDNNGDFANTRHQVQAAWAAICRRINISE